MRLSICVTIWSLLLLYTSYLVSESKLNFMLEVHTQTAYYKACVDKTGHSSKYKCLDEAKQYVTENYTE